MEVQVSSPSRLHLGLLSDAHGKRAWQGIGLAVKEPRTTLYAKKSSSSGIHLSGNFFDEELNAIIQNVYRLMGIDLGIELDMIEYPPRHVGLGSGTQIVLSVAAAIAKIANVGLSIDEIALRANRGKYSWIGVETFKRGGFIISLGRGKESIQPVIRLEFPDEWFIVMLVPDKSKGFSGRLEEELLSHLKYSDQTILAIYSSLINEVLPGILERDLELFGKGIEKIQRLVGYEFREIQGGIYNVESSKLINLLCRSGLQGVGQSSWGPTVYGFTDKKEEAYKVASLIKKHMSNVKTYVSNADNQGARITYW